jgi:hypothetical protein
VLLLSFYLDVFGFFFHFISVMVEVDVEVDTVLRTFTRLSSLPSHPPADHDRPVSPTFPLLHVNFLCHRVAWRVATCRGCVVVRGGSNGIHI